MCATTIIRANGNLIIKLTKRLYNLWSACIYIYIQLTKILEPKQLDDLITKIYIYIYENSISVGDLSCSLNAERRANGTKKNCNILECIIIDR